MTRHELKEQLQHDHFTDAVSDVVNYALSNRQVFIRWVIALVAVLVIAGAAFWYSSYAKSVRQQELRAALAVVDAQVGPANEYSKTYPTQDAKTQASIKALSDLVAKHSGTREGLIAQYYLGTLKARQNDTKGAESDLRRVADSRSECAPLAKIALAQLYAGENRVSDAQNLLRSIVNKPTDLVSKAQAQILLARLDQTANPAEAKSILQSLKAPNQSPAVTHAVDQLSAESAK